jgi:purine-binding chemotaxis protein CheW
MKQDNRYMEFRLGEQLYAIPLLTIKEVIQMPEVTAVPNMPAHFEGMMNLRGQILGVFNLRKKLALKASEGGAHVVMVIEEQNVNVGMIVDEVTRVLHPDENMLKPAPLKDNDPANEFIKSVIQTGQDLVLTVDLVKLLDLNKYKAMAA